MTEYFYERFIDETIDTGETIIRRTQQDIITKAQADTRRKTAILPAKTTEKIHIHEHNEPLARNKNCILRDLRP